MEAVKKNDVKCAGPEEMKAREQQVDTLKEMIRQLEECKVKEASTSEATVEALKKQSEGLLLEYDRLLAENQDLRYQLQTIFMLTRKPINVKPLLHSKVTEYTNIKK